MKRIIVMILTITLILGGITFAAATPADVEGTDYETAVEKLAALGVLAGYPDGTFRPDNTIKRCEFAKIAVLLLGLGDAAVYAQGTTIFSDVAADHWASGYINIAVEKGLLRGYPDGSFAPEAEVTYAEAITILVRLLGYGPTVDIGGSWPSNYIAKAAALGLTRDVRVTGSAPAKRGNVAILVENCLETKMWGETGYDSEGRVTYGPKNTTVLSELGIYGDKLKEDVTVTKTPLTGGTAPGKLTVGSATYKFAGDAEKYFGLKVNLWLNKEKDEILYIDVRTDDDDIIVGRFDEWDGHKIKVVEDDEYYAFDGDAVIYYNGSRLYNGIDIDAAALKDMLDDLTNGPERENEADVRLVLNGSGKVKYAAVWQEKSNGNLGNTLNDAVVTAGIVDEVSSTRIRMFGTAAIRIKDIKDKVDDGDEYLLVKRNGSPATLADIEEGDSVTYYRILAGSKPINYFVVSGRKVTGKVTEIIGTHSETKFVVGGTKYEVAADVLSTRDSEDPEKVALGTDILKDFVGQNVVLTLNAMGEVILVKTSAPAVSRANYGMLKELISGSTTVVASIDSNAKVVYYVKVVNSQGNEVVLKFKDNTSPGGLDSYQRAIAADVGALVSWKLDNSGYVKEFRYANSAGDITLADAGVVDAANTKVVDDPDIFMDTASGLSLFVTFDTIVWNMDNNEVVKGWKSVVNAADALGILGADVVYKRDGSKLQYLVIDESGITTDVEYAIFIEKGVNADGDTYKLMKSNGRIATYNVYTEFGTDVEKGDLVAYKLNSEGEFVVAVVTDITSTAAGEEGLVVDRNADYINYLAGQGAPAMQFGLITKIDTKNRLITFGQVDTNGDGSADAGGGTFVYDKDLVVYETIKTSEIGVVDIEDVYEDYDMGYLIMTDASSQKYDILVIVKR